MGSGVNYPTNLKMKTIEMRLAGILIKKFLDKLKIRNYSQLKTWMRW